MNVSGQKSWLRRTEILLLFLGSLCAGYCLLIAIEAAGAMRSSKNLGSLGSPANIVYAKTDPLGETAAADAASPSFSSVMGRLDIPALSLSVPILSDYQTESLLKGVGHIPGTAMPGGLGTLGLAGHRDTYFRPLRNIKKDMTIQVADQNGTYRYSVDSTEIVKPENVEVLDIGNRPALTLVTCYPFYYVGAAPLRFIVHAHLLSAAPDVTNR